MMSESVGGNLGSEVETVTLDGQRQEEYLASTIHSRANFTSEVYINTTVQPCSDMSLNSTAQRCGCMDSAYMNIWHNTAWWCEGTLFTGVGVCGLLFNLLSIGILSTKEMRKHTFNQLLIALCACDVVFIIVSVPVYSFSYFEILQGNPHFAQLYVYFLYPMSPVTLCASVYMTLAITIERYLAVCKPIIYRNLVLTTSSTIRAMMYVTPVVLVSFCLNIPKFMETKSTQNEQTGGYEAKVSDMRLDEDYAFYYTISMIFHPTLTTAIIPMVALIFMNTAIFFGIRKQILARSQRRATTNQYGSSAQLEQNNSNGQNNSGQSETNLAVTLVGITTMHLICNALRVFLAVYAVYLVTDTIYCTTYHEGGFVPPLWAMVAESVSSLLVMINFSGNFLIYCCTLKPFKAYIASWIGHFRKTPDSTARGHTMITMDGTPQIRTRANTVAGTPLSSVSANRSSTNGGSQTNGNHLGVPPTNLGPQQCQQSPLCQESQQVSNGVTATLLVASGGGENKDQDNVCKTITIQVGSQARNGELSKPPRSRNIWQRLLRRRGSLSSNLAGSQAKPTNNTELTKGTIQESSGDGAAVTAERLQKYRKEAAVSKRRRLLKTSKKQAASLSLTTPGQECLIEDPPRERRFADRSSPPQTGDGSPIVNESKGETATSTTPLINETSNPLKDGSSQT